MKNNIKKVFSPSDLVSSKSEDTILGKRQPEWTDEEKVVRPKYDRLKHFSFVIDRLESKTD